MKPKTASRRAALEALHSMAMSDSDAQAAMFAKKFRQAILLFGSHSEDNVQATSIVDYVTTKEPNAITSGLGVRPSGLLLCDIVYQIEAGPMPAEVATKFPQLTQSEWEAAMRILVLMLSAMNRRTVLDS